mmetsp:Transcript_38540/g.62126  ORF Transcript_38540/g.62126 Transcript_38540/m.62126 type:complete len:114 (+) Transcript_38540:123-464(+)
MYYSHKHTDEHTYSRTTVTNSTVNNSRKTASESHDFAKAMLLYVVCCSVFSVFSVVWCGAGGVVRCGAVWCSVERANLTISQKLSTKPLTNVPCSLEKFIRVSVHTCDKALEF